MEKEDTIGGDDEFNIEYLPEDYAQYDLSFKIIVIGDSGVGKSCLTTKAVKNSFEEYYQATVGFEFLTFNLKLNDCIIKLQIWDTCGQEIYRSLISNFYRNSSLAIMLYAIDNLESFEHTNSWLNELKNQANPDVRIFLVGNKADLAENRKVSKEDAEKYKTEHNLDLFCETSAKTGYNAKSVIVEAAKYLYRDYLNLKASGKEEDKTKTENSGQKLNKNSNEVTQNANKKKCCI